MQIVRGLDEEFTRVSARSVALVRAVPPEKLYWQPPGGRERFFPVYSCGEHVLRAAAAVEQTFGGINANLWDDPFEWTLPETLKTTERIIEYLAEVEATRRQSFERFSSDGDLIKEISVPSGETRPLGALLFETLARASHYQGRAFAVFRQFSAARLPRL